MSVPSVRARPTAPKWDTTRPFMTGSAQFDAAIVATPPSLAAHSPSMQHALVAEDALHALLGMRPTYANLQTDAAGSVHFTVRSVLQSAHPPIEPLYSRVLVLAAHHVVVRRFVETTRVARADGFVTQAVGVALSELLADYRTFILRLETALRTSSLSLQKLLYYVQPSERSMSLLRKIVQCCEGRRGGAALDALYKLAISHVGSDDTHHVLSFVIGKAAAPILTMMDAWIRKGIVDDPFSEFFVSENRRLATVAAKSTDTSSSKVWEMRYTVCKDNLPDFLVPFIENILRSGKYLNVLRECGVNTTHAVAEANQKLRTALAENATERNETALYDRFSPTRLSGEVLLGPDASRMIAQVIQSSFNASSLALKTYLDSNVRVVERLRSLRKYFLLEQSDFLVHFFDSAAGELAKNRADVSKSRLSSLLELSIRTSVSASDSFHDDLSCTLFPNDLASHILVMVGTEEDATSQTQKSPFITGFESFSLDYKLKWPMNLIIPEMEIIKYQLLFRYLFYCKHVERELEECWRNHSQVKGVFRKVRHHFVRSFALRNRMLQFVRNILYYTVADVIEPNWRHLEAGIKKANTIDEIMQHHYNFLQNSVIQSLLSNERHLKVFKNISQTCLSFAGYTETFSELLVKESSVEAIEEGLRARNYPAGVAKFETTFDMHLGKLLDGLSAVSKKRANVHLANLCERLDVGGFYGRTTERSMASFGSYGL